jgi:cytochrome P450
MVQERSQPAVAHLKLPSGPRGRFLLGSMLELSCDWMGFLTRSAHEYGDVVFFRFLNVPICLLTHPNDIENVLVTNQSNFVKSRDYRVLARVLGNGLITAEGEVWRERRKLVQPAFHHERIAGYAKVMVECARNMMAEWQHGEARDIHRSMMGLTLEIVAKVLFGAEVSDKAPVIAKAIQVMMEEFTKHANLAFVLPESLPLPITLGLRRGIRPLDTIVYSIIRDRRSNPSNSQDLLDTLLQTVHEDGSPMTDLELRDEMVTLLVAGHETTAAALSWTWYLLAQHPQVEAKLLAEIGEVLGGREPEVGDLPRLRYTDLVLKESMRLYPPAWGVGRRALREFEAGGYRLPAGTNVLLMQWITHRDPRFYPDPERFDPERWIEKPDQTSHLPRFTYFPFGGGPRMCLGSSFAMVEATLLVAAIAQKFRFSLAPGQRVEILPSVTLRPKYGIKMILERRQR